MKIKSLQTDKQMFLLVEFDHIFKLAEQLGVSAQDPGGRSYLKQVLQAFFQSSEKASGWLIDPELGWPLVSDNKKAPGTLLPVIQKLDEIDPLSVPKTLSEWGVEHISNNFSTASIELFYHPEEVNALQKKQLIAELYDFCHHQNLDLVLKLVIFTPAQEDFDPKRFQEAQMEALQEFRAVSDLLILQFPQDPLACATLTAELDNPWLLSGDGAGYDDFKQHLRESLESGARGCSVGEILWKEIETMRHDDTSPDREQIEKFISTTVRDRVIELRRIVDEFSGTAED